MTVHHPEAALLFAYAGGSLDAAQRLLIAAHCANCSDCAKAARAFECLGGVLLEDEREAPLAPDSLQRALLRLDSEPTRQSTAQTAFPTEPGLPRVVSAHKLGDWRWLAPGVRRRTIDLGPNPPTRAFLLKAAGGISLLPHGHSALEWTLVLSGAFTEGGEPYRKGDFVAADQDDHHQIKIEPGEACVCLIAMQGEMKWRGPLAPLANFLFRL